MHEKPDSKAMHEVTVLLAKVAEGNRGAADDLIPLVYAELRKIAAYYLKAERAGHTLQPTALVHEAFLKLVEQKTEWQNRAHFFAMAVNMMRRILVDYARGHLAQKRGGAAEKLSLDDAFIFASERPAEMIALDEALEELATVDPRRSRVVELKFFGGLTHDEIAEVLDVHPNTVLRDWKLARAWLKTRI
jgi:RNA polymerase sigma factor (TIGR02999 family)